MPEAPIPLKVKNLVKHYGEVKAVDDISFEIQPGEIFGLLGPNGAGKTSIISTIVTLEEPTAGSVEVFGYDVSKYPKMAKIHTGWVPQEIINHGYFNVEEILTFHSGYYGIWKNQERIDFLMKRLDLWDHKHKKVKQLSGGMKRRLLIAKSLVHRPKLLLLDEPTAGVDVELRASLWAFVKELQSEGTSILLTTHYLEEAEELCERVGIIHKGKVRQIGKTSDLIKEFTKREFHLDVKPGVKKIDHPCLVKQEDEKLIFRVSSDVGMGELLDELQFDLKKLKDVQIIEGNLEDAFNSVLGGA